MKSKTKNIKDYLEGIEEGDLVPSIRGIIRKVTEPKEKGKPQVITIQSEDDSDRINLWFKNHLIAEAAEGDMLSITASSPAKGKPSTGLQLKTSKNTGKDYIVVTTGTEISHTKAPTEDIPQLGDPEPMTAADSMIDNYVLDRLYIYKRVVKIANETEVSYPDEKFAELATAVHIELSRAGKSPRPTDQQLERKRVHKDAQLSGTDRNTTKPSVQRPEGVASHAVNRSAGWRKFKHPISGVLLGDEPVEKIGVTFAPWALKTDRDRLEDKMKPLHDAVMEAIEDLGLEYQDILEAYAVAYVHSTGEKSQKKRDELLKRFYQGLVDQEYVKREGQPTNKEALTILRQFPKDLEANHTMNNHGPQILATLTPEEVRDFKEVYQAELALKQVIDDMMASAQKMGKELIMKRKEFWDRLLAKHGLELDEKYAIDIQTETLISVTE